MTIQKGPYLGAHTSTAGGIVSAIDRGREIEAQAIQLFTKNSNQWRAKELTSKEIDSFRAGREEAEFRFAFAHDSYLINLASPNEELRAKSMTAFLDEMDRGEALGLEFIVFHPGAHMGAGTEEGCGKVADALNRLISKRPKQSVQLLIENAAGQGTTLGRTFEELALIRDAVEAKARVGYCFDTCHAFAGGYDLRTAGGYADTMKSFDAAAGVSNIKAFHLNDSKKGLLCRVDRHEHIGKGELGEEAFRSLLNDPRFRHHPMVLETPKSEDLHEDRENLARLRSLM